MFFDFLTNVQLHVRTHRAGLGFRVSRTILSKINMKLTCVLNSVPRHSRPPGPQMMDLGATRILKETILFRALLSPPCQTCIHLSIALIQHDCDTFVAAGRTQKLKVPFHSLVV